MSAFLVAYIAPIMFCGLVVFMLLGFPVAFALAALGLLFGMIGIQLGPRAGKANIATNDVLKRLLADASVQAGADKFTQNFLLSEWSDVGSVEELSRQPLQEVRIGKAPIALSYLSGTFSAVSGVNCVMRMYAIFGSSQT